MIELSKDNFDVVITDKPGLALVDFWSPGCGPCRILYQVLKQAEQRHPSVTFATCDASRYPDVAFAFEVMATPTMVLFRDGVPVDSLVGAVPLPAVEQFLRRRDPARADAEPPC